MSVQIDVHDTSVQEIILDIANALKIDPELDNNELCLRIPEKLGSGFIKATQFEYGIGVLEFECLLKEDLVLRHQKGLVHPLKLIFNRESEIFHSYDNNDEIYEIQRMENAILSSTPQNNHIFTFPANAPFCVFSLEINRKLFEGKIDNFLANMNDDLVDLFRDVNGVRAFYHKKYYSLEIKKILEEFTECDLTDFMKTVYQEGKAYEILSYQLQQYLDDLNGNGNIKILQQATREKIEKVAQIIKNELSQMDNIVALAKRVGLNQNTLQQGFKRIFKSSVNEYVRNIRIEKAKELLETTDLNMTEISYKIGINSRSYFSKLFKKNYGQTPKQYYKEMQKKNGNNH